MEKKLIEMSNFLKELLKKNNIEAKIQYRVKRIYSIFKKSHSFQGFTFAIYLFT